MTTAPALKVEELKSLRANNKGNITRIFNHISKHHGLSVVELECRLGLVDNYYKQASFYQSSIEKAIPADTGRADIDETYICAKTQIISLINEQRDPASHEQTILGRSSPSHRLPHLQLPKFDGKYAEYKNFILSFQSLLHSDPNISVIEKFNHLLSCLSGEALNAVKAFQVSRENYQRALDRLKERYDNDTLIFLENISSIFEVEKVSKADSKQLRTVVDTITALYNSLKSLGTYEEICDAIIIHLALSKVDSGTKQRWDDSLDFSKLPKWNECCHMLDRRCQQLDAQSRSNNKPHPSFSNASNSKSKRYTLTSSANSEKMCTFCSKSGHNVFGCNQFLGLSIDQRYSQAKHHQLCLNCLGKGHMMLQCPSKSSCRVCKLHHHSLLHRTKENSSSTTATSAAALSNSSKIELPPTSSATVQTTLERTKPITESQIILATAIVLIKDRRGEYQAARALLDSCSQVNFMSETLTNTLNMPKSKNLTQIMGIGSTSFNVQHKTHTTVRSRVNNFEMTLEFLISNKITGYHPESFISSKQINVPKNIDLADPHFYRPQKIDLLLGAEAFFQLLAVGQIRLGDGLPILQKTLFGWIVSGRCDKKTSLKASSIQSKELSEDTVAKSLEKFWELETVECKRQSKSLEQQQCERHFLETTCQNVDGRITVRLPFKTNPAILGNSYDIAHRRFIMLERKLDRNPVLKDGYIKFMREYEELHHMTICRNFDLSSLHYFIPHHCVMKPDSETTKLRVVFDASRRTSSQVSLNEILMVGPTIQNELLITLLRFRCYRYGLTADVTKMYRQVLVHHDDTRFQLILWRENPSLPLQVYRLNTVTYGTASAPFLAIKSLQYATEKFGPTHELGKAAILNDFYVDDMLTGSDDLETLKIIKRQVVEILNSCQLSLAKWHCNHESMHNVSTDKDISFDEDITSTLGISWHPKTDELIFSFKPRDRSKTVTKRSILSLTSSLFDPLGLLSPLIINAKMMLQRLWMCKCDWDESVAQDIQTSWDQILAEFEKIQHIRIPRFTRIANFVEIQIHGFGDASIKAYGCCLYFRCTDSCGNINVNLIASKSRVAPVRVQSLPRLELCAAHLLVKFWKKIRSHFSFNIHQVHFWSDSQIVLHWIGMHSSLLSTFVGNRIAEIQELSQDVQWHHVTSINNPADLISRGCTVNELMHSHWFEGPTFLAKSYEFWPPEKPLQINEKEHSLERKRSSFVVEERPIPYLLQVAHKYSNHLKCLRVLSYVIRFAKHTRPSSTLVTSIELQNTLHIIVSVIQQHYFYEEILQLQKHNVIKGSCGTLSPFLDKSNNIQLLRVGGRLQNASIRESAKTPLLLPKADPFVKTYVEHLHRVNFHAGARALMAQIQERFWIVNCRSLVRQVVNKCILCSRYRPKLLSQIMGQLPKDRVSANRPFEICGIDFAGPVTTYYGIRGKPPFKSYIAVFVCFCTKAVHLDAVPNLSSEAFINVLKRFIGRRGLPSKIYCDNATNFVGAAKRLKELHQQFFSSTNINKIQFFCSSSSIDFCFIPPRAQNFGGLWEAAVKSAKSLLHRTLFNAHLTLEELRTALVEIEAIMNSRPISSMSTSPNDFQALTPGHFLIGRPLRSLPEPSTINTDFSRLQGFQRITALKAHFWKRWHKEYLLDMQNRYRWKRPQRNLEVNDLVIIHDDNLPPMAWPLGRIIRVFPGKDGYVRVAEIKTATTTLRRPISKLAVLSID